MTENKKNKNTKPTQSTKPSKANVPKETVKGGNESENISIISLQLEIEGERRWISVRPQEGALKRERLRYDGFSARTKIKTKEKRMPVLIEGTPVTGVAAKYMDDNSITGGFSFAIWKDDGRRFDAVVRSIRY